MTEHVSFRERMTAGQLYQNRRESLKERVSRLIVDGGIETAENLVKAVPFANRFEVAFKLRQASCQE